MMVCDSNQNTFVNKIRDIFINTFSPLNVKALHDCFCFFLSCYFYGPLNVCEGCCLA